jgi:hypothetical protein
MRFQFYTHLFEADAIKLAPALACGNTPRGDCHALAGRCAR